MARTKGTPWIVMQGEQGKCLRCGDTLHVQLPVLVEVWVAAARAFVKAHSRCKEAA
jgi:hypothetical protein